MENVVTLKDLITLLAFGAAAPVLSYNLVKWLREQRPAWTYLGAWWVSVAIAPVIAVVFYGVGLAMRYYEQPGPDWRLWVEQLFTVSWPVILVASGIHAATTSASLPDNGRKA
jgi:hypothetical protein